MLIRRCCPPPLLFLFKTGLKPHGHPKAPQPGLDLEDSSPENESPGCNLQPTTSWGGTVSPWRRGCRGRRKDPACRARAFCPARNQQQQQQLIIPNSAMSTESGTARVCLRESLAPFSRKGALPPPSPNPCRAYPPPHTHTREAGQVAERQLKQPIALGAELRSHLRLTPTPVRRATPLRSVPLGQKSPCFT